jgi:acetyl-CoA carboxylase, biotin carboxylase subunit
MEAPVRILIANRGEIAVRVIRACREMGLSSVAVYSDCDRDARHVRDADHAERIGGDRPADSYLHIDAIVDAARRTGATAVHPGYGFLAENAAFAAACRDAGLVFVGPSPEAIALMGSKTAARAAALEVGVPVVPGSGALLDAAADGEALVRAAATVGYPLLVKAVAGGGGKGMRAVERPADLLAAAHTARSEAGSAFGDSSIYLERRLVRPRHVEVQLLGDGQGSIVPFVERECSIQRRHQKVVEESPSLAVSPALRARMAEAAVAVARAVQYTSAGTVEFLLDEDGAFYFLEMNTRLQVEHPVTEMVTGIDLVQWQLRIARGERLDVDPGSALTPTGHAIECRIYAEDPDEGFMPSPGLIRHVRAASGPGVRDDSGISAGYRVPLFYDSLLAKLITWGASRGDAIARTIRALEEYQVLGIRTTIPFFLWLMRQPDYLQGRYDTTYLDQLLDCRGGRSFSELAEDEEAVVAMAVGLDAALRAHGRADGRGTGRSRWTDAARREGLRQ